MSAFVEYCQSYHDKGYSVIPIHPGTKRPFPNEWSTWASNPLPKEKLVEWKSKVPNGGIGLCLGPQSGLTAFDYDLDLTDPLHKELHDKIVHLLPKSPVSKLGKKGGTLFFRFNGEESTTIKKPFGKAKGSLNVCEVLAAGRQTVLPPSIHPETGEPYRWNGEADLLACDPSNLPILPQENIEEIRRIVNHWTPTVDTEVGDDRRRSGGRNDQLKTMATAAIHAGKADDAIAAELREYDLKNHQPPLFSDSSDTQYAGKPAEQNALRFVKSVRRSIGVEPTIHLVHEPIPLIPELGPETPYPVDALGPILGGAAKVMYEAVQAPLALCGQSILAATTLATQPHANVLVDGRSVPICNNFISIAESGERKTALDNQALLKHYERERHLRELYREEMKRFKAKKTLYEKALGERLAKAKSREEIDGVFQTLEEPLELVNPRFLTEEPTTEGILKLLNEGNRTVGVFSSEGVQMFSGYAFKEDNFAKTAGFFSRAWDGHRVDNTRATSESITVDNPRVAIHAMIQPVIAEKVIKNPLLNAQGFLARALICYPISTIGDRPYRKIDLTQSEPMQRYWSVMEEILIKPLPFGDVKSRILMPRSLKLQVDAYERYVAFYNHVESRLKPGAELFDVREFGCKAAEHVLRISGVLALIDDFNTTEIAAPVVDRAVAIVDYHIAERLRLLGMVADPAILLAKRLLDWCHDQNLQQVYPKKVQQLGPRPLRAKKDAAMVYSVLEEHGWFQPLPSNTVIDEKPRKKAWEVIHV